MFFGPLPAKADFFSSIFGNSASASVDQDPSSTADQNSQNMNLLQSDVSSSSVIQDKNSKDTSSNTDINTNIVADNALDAVTSPLGVSDGTANDDPSSDQISVYVIRAGDTISEIAGMYGVSANTILWANNLKKGDKLVEGKILMILPVSGVKIGVA
jgi:LysM repeat protein